MVGGYMEDLAKAWNCQNLCVGTCMEMGVCLGQYIIQNNIVSSSQLGTHFVYKGTFWPSKTNSESLYTNDTCNNNNIIKPLS